MPDDNEAEQLDTAVSKHRIELGRCRSAYEKLVKEDETLRRSRRELHDLPQQSITIDDGTGSAMRVPAPGSQGPFRDQERREKDWLQRFKHLCERQIPNLFSAIQSTLTLHAAESPSATGKRDACQALPICRPGFDFADPKLTLSAMGDLDALLAKPGEEIGVDRPFIEAADEPSSRRTGSRGPESKIKRHNAIAAVVRLHGDKWRSSLKLICTTLDKQGVSISTSWEERRITTWNNMLSTSQKAVENALEYALDRADP